MDPKALPYHDYPHDMRPLPYTGAPPPSGGLHSPNHSAGFHSPYYLQHQMNPLSPAQIVQVDPQLQKIYTLFVSGLPEDVKAREIYNLFSRHYGFDSCQLKYTGRDNQVFAFVTFINHHSAMAALGALDRTIFDPETRAVLHIELARSNSKKRSRGGATFAIIDKRRKVQKVHQTDLHDDGHVGSDEALDTEKDDSHNKAATQSGNEEAKSANDGAALDSEKATKNIPPCSTLFIANLGPTCTEEELKDVLSKFSGFHTLKMKGRAEKPVAFADFENIESSTAALQSLKGTLLDSSDRGGMHIEFAKSQMRII